jgi:hypothetical protein
LLAVLTLLLVGSPAMADPPSRLDEQVDDRVGALRGSEEQVRAALDRLREEDGIQLFVVVVSSFDGQGGQDWAEQTAVLSQLGPRDVLLAVAVDDRAYGISVDARFPVSDAAIDDIVAQNVEPRLAAGDTAGAVVAFADGLREGGASGGGQWTPLAWVVGGAAVVGGGTYLLSRRRRRRAQADHGTGPAGPDPQQPADEYAGTPTADLSYRASAALIELDDAVRTSEQELAFAQSRFGDEAVAGFRRALEESRAEMVEAFGLRQRLDDDQPEDEGAQRVLLAEILRLCRSADERLDAQAEAFDRLRDLESTAPEVVAALGPRIAAAEARLPEETARLERLRGRYAAAALVPVVDNVGQAERLLAAARTEVEQAQAAVTADRRPEAAVSARAAEDALAQAAVLLDGVGRLESELDAAGARFADARAEVEQDLAEARALLAAGDPGGLAPVVARAEAGLAAADREQAGTDGFPDPLAALRRLDEIGAALDDGLDAAREAQARNARAAAMLDHALLAARSSVAAASDFVTTRRGAVGGEARTRLAEAQRHLDMAAGLAERDPAAALREAQRADELAQDALRVARDDVGRWSDPAGSAPGGSGVDLGSLILGGILFGGRGGGGGYGGPGGWGGGGWSGGPGWGGGSGRGGRGGGGGFSPGSFGGSGTRGRRGTGGRF